MASYSSGCQQRHDSFDGNGKVLGEEKPTQNAGSVNGSLIELGHEQGFSRGRDGWWAGKQRWIGREGIAAVLSHSILYGGDGEGGSVPFFFLISILLTCMGRWKNG